VGEVEREEGGAEDESDDEEEGATDGANSEEDRGWEVAQDEDEDMQRRRTGHDDYLSMGPSTRTTRSSRGRVSKSGLVFEDY